MVTAEAKLTISTIF